MGNKLHTTHLVNTPVGFAITKGVNISHWLSQTNSVAREGYISEEDIITIKSLGFDHVRIPIDEQELWNEDGLIIGKSFLLLKKCMEWCLKHSIKAIIVLKKLRNFNSQFSDDDTSIIWHDILVQETFFKMWRNLSDFLKDFPKSKIAYELLNEPNAPDDNEWNIFVNQAIKSIRIKEPERVIFVGSNNLQSEANIVNLSLPEDENIVISFRFFKPFGLTHYKAEWTPLKNYNGAVQYPGTVLQQDILLNLKDRSQQNLKNIIQDEKLFDFWNKEKLAKVLKPAINFAEKNKRQMYCSQFGCLPTVPSEMRSQYYQDVLNCFKNNGIAFSFWDYKGRFGVMKQDNKGGYIPEDVIINCLK